MTIDETTARQAAFAAAAEMERQLGDGTVLTVGTIEREISARVRPAPRARIVSAPYAGSAGSGTAAALLGDRFAAALEARVPDELLVTAVRSALVAAVSQLGREYEVRADRTREDDVEPAGDDLLVFPLLDGDTLVACVVFTPAMAPGPVVDLTEEPQFSSEHSYVIPIGDARYAMLARAELEVRAELGRRRMSMRDLLLLTPGSVIPLDRPADGIVDLFVKGTLIARGEVVVVDEEFGVRIAAVRGGGAQ